MMRAVFLGLAIAACSDSYTVVTVTARSGITGVTALAVTASNGGSSETATLPLDAHAFPATFSLTTTDRTGELEVTVDALGSDGTLLGLGSTTGDAGSALAVRLDPADFVVNTDATGEHFVTADFETIGFQVAATDGGPWTVAFRDDCTDDCQIFARMFEPDGTPAESEVAASTSQFPISNDTIDDQSFPAVAASGVATLAAWDLPVANETTGGVGCRGISAEGALTTTTAALTTAPADTVTVAALSTGDFAIAWQVTEPSDAIETVLAHADCSAGSAGLQAVSTTVGSADGPHRPSIADNGASVLYTWITDGAVHARAGTPDGTLNGPEAVLYAPPTGYVAAQARVATVGDGFGVAVRIAATNGTSGGSIQLLLANAAGQVLSTTPAVISDQTGADFSVGLQGFGMATRSDGITLIAWQQCADGGAGPCTGDMDVYGRAVDGSGTPIGSAFEIPTTTAGDQTAPSVAALGSAFAVTWNDDGSGQVVRARVVYAP